MILKKKGRRCRQILWLTVLFTAPLFLHNALAESLNQAVFARRTEIAWQQAQAQYLAATNGSPAAWVFARACYNLADFATNDDNRADLANQGIDACRKLLLKQPKSGAAYYYLGMNQGQLARTKLLGALKLVREMEREFKTAWSLDKEVDHGGPARSLGLLYRDAPGWSVSIGSKRKAHEWLERAALFDPVFPENLMVLCESYLKWDEVSAADEKLKKLDALWPQAQTNFTGVIWEHDWADWSARRDAIRAKIKEEQAAAGPVRSPRQSD